MIKKIEFSGVDSNVMVFLGQPGFEIKLFRIHEKMHSWAKTDKSVSGIAWLVGMPYLLVLSGGRFFIYDSAPR